MSRWKSNPLIMWVSPTRTAFYQQRQAGGALLADLPWTNEQNLAQHIDRCLQQLPASRCTLQIILDDALVRYWKVTPPQNIARLDDLRAAARIRFEALYDLPLSDWIIEADWHATEVFLACAIPASLILGLSQRLNQPEYRHVTVTGYDPAFIYHWNHHQPQLANTMEGFGVLGTGTMTVALIHNAKITAVRCLPLADLQPHSLQALDQAIQNLGLQLEIAPPGKIWLTGNLPDAWKPYKTSHIKWRRLPPDATPPAPTTVPQAEGVA